ncbi:MAG TPA: methylated-DNA--[protein]-cysteine S-methyltransferase [Solirubrobacteraceae bacterium]
MINDVFMPLSDDDVAVVLRARGLRVTPQRRTILSAFAGERDEHLSADEVHERCRATLPDLGRGTVYATLAELSRLGILRALGRAEPIRYETNVGAHSHFRCTGCERLYDIDIDRRLTPGGRIEGFTIEHAHIELEGMCPACDAFVAGLRRAARAARAEATERLRRLPAARLDTAVGTLVLVASERGLARVAFEDHADAGLLGQRASSRRPAAPGRHLDDARRALERYFSPAGEQPACAVDWEAVPTAMHVPLRATTAIAVGEQRPYARLMEGTTEPATSRAIGTALGGNPVPIVLPCHRVVRGDGDLVAYTGGLERKRALLDHEHAVAGG